MRSRQAKGKRSTATRLRTALVALALLLVAAAAAVSWAIETLDVPPRVLANHVARRASGHNEVTLTIGNRLAELLSWLDRSDDRTMNLPELRLGAQAGSASPSALASARVNVVLVATAADAAQAIQQARPGDVITFAPGTYRFTGSGIAVNRAGTSTSGIVVRADRPGTVLLEFDMTEGFVVSEPHWTFENLSIRGVCALHSSCEHAFHIVSRATRFTARNNTITEFNAHFKINGSDGKFPDDGLIEGNTLSNSSVRDTDSSVTPIDLVAASRWVIRGNRISDFAKAGSDRVSYGAFAKGGGAGNNFERNIVLCENLLRGVAGQRVGISLGGGGTGKEYCRDTRCITEQDSSTIQSNLIMSCSDDGIYLNRSATSQVRHNTLIDTGGISVRFVESSADVAGNMVDGTVRSRDGGALHATDNVQTSMTRLYLGSHPVRALYRNLAGFDLSWAASPPRRQRDEVAMPDLCGSKRPPRPAHGAFEDFSECLRQPQDQAPAR